MRCLSNVDAPNPPEITFDNGAFEISHESEVLQFYLFVN